MAKVRRYSGKGAYHQEGIDSRAWNIGSWHATEGAIEQRPVLTEKARAVHRHRIGDDDRCRQLMQQVTSGMRIMEYIFMHDYSDIFFLYWVHCNDAGLLLCLI